MSYKTAFILKSYSRSGFSKHDSVENVRLRIKWRKEDFMLSYGCEHLDQ